MTDVVVLGGGVAPPSGLAPPILDDYLLRQDFVVEAIRDDRPTDSWMSRTLHVTKVLLGSVSSDHLVLRNDVTGLRGSHSDVPRPVLAWGTHTWASGDTCYGNQMEIRRDGSLDGHVGGQRLLLDGEQVSVPGAYERLVARLEQRAGEHPAEWLARGETIAIVPIIGIGRHTRTIAVGPGRIVLGASPDRWPRSIHWQPRMCIFAPSLADSILVALRRGDGDTLQIICPERLLVNAERRATVLGVPVDRLEDVLTSNGTSVVIRRMRATAGR